MELAVLLLLVRLVLVSRAAPPLLKDTCTPVGGKCLPTASSRCAGAFTSSYTCTAAGQSCCILPVDCVVGSWSTWRTCSVTCGTGQQTRSRDVVEQPQNNGTACPDQTDTSPCTEPACPELTTTTTEPQTTTTEPQTTTTEPQTTTTEQETTTTEPQTTTTEPQTTTTEPQTTTTEPETTTTEPDPTAAHSSCHCIIVADPVVSTCSGKLLFFAQSDGPVTAVVSQHAACPVTVKAVAVWNSLQLSLVIGANSWEILPTGTISPATPIPSAAISHFVHDQFSGVSVAFSCGLEIRFGRVGDSFVKADINVPSGILANSIEGFCITEQLNPPTTTESATTSA